ncbi:NAD(P)/FAD-dependent oxidoreductase [Chelativorans sp. J32]|uniref:protoporphyrinogen/coproporphyrinogen oxidase n=1 Tax=Chelativorans sp. J32 TaxID=935840 RepID=UPI0004B374D7|nr:FAD-dependent oxidoreductase [Chelativorans sp. J32]
MQSKAIIVVGSGISGLTAAYRLQQQGHRVTVLEEQGRFGGRMGEGRIRDIQFAYGARLLYPFSKPTIGLVRELGLQPSLVPIRKLGADCGQGGENWRIELMPGVQSLLTPGLSLAERARFIAFGARLLALRTRTNPDDLTSAVEYDDETLASFIARVLGPRVLERMVEPTFRGTRSWNPEEISAAFFMSTTPHLIGQDTVYGFRKGMGEMPQALAALLDVRLNCPVTAIETGEGKPRVTYLAQGRQVTEEPDLVVAAVEGSLVRGLVHGLEAEDRAFFEGVRYNSLGIVHYALGSDIAPAMRFFTRDTKGPLSTYQQVPARPGRPAQIYAQLTPEAEREALASANPLGFDGPVAEQVKDLLPAFETNRADSYNQRIARKLPIFYPGYARKLRAFLDRQASQPRRVYYCGDYLAQALVTGAVSSGMAVAQAIARDWA